MPVLGPVKSIPASELQPGYWLIWASQAWEIERIEHDPVFTGVKLVDRERVLYYKPDEPVAVKADQYDF